MTGRPSSRPGSREDVNDQQRMNRLVPNSLARRRNLDSPAEAPLVKALASSAAL